MPLASALPASAALATAVPPLLLLAAAAATASTPSRTIAASPVAAPLSVATHRVI